ncbi:MAG TPA: pyridoxamine 5'-phosphate oxidase family protein [Gemmatimonadaceae bacterium]|nr:pyridoxamine 5'-phosphate oxidase family protein [Gemmatimonadaceae bacterium]
MSTLYSTAHRALQDEFNRRPLADLLDAAIVHSEIAPAEKSFIERLDMFFLATVDPQGRPTVSYKGGAPGFVRVPDSRTIAFPVYDGNGMFYSMGNIEATRRVGLLFIDFATPHRLRVQGDASLIRDPRVLSTWPGAQLAVHITPTEIFVNCGRYIHKRVEVEPSPYLPDAEGHAPVPAWKCVDVVQDVLAADERQAVTDAGGPIDLDEYNQRVANGKP